MGILLGRPDVDGLSQVVSVLRDWQYEGAPMGAVSGVLVP
jgi:hypothetical protein